MTYHGSDYYAGCKGGIGGLCLGDCDKELYNEIQEALAAGRHVFLRISPKDEVRMNSIDMSIVLDESGSMRGCRGDTVKALNSYIDDQRKVPGVCTVTLAQFSDPGRFNYTYKGESIQTVPSLNDQNYNPAGSTALLDAVGRVIDHTGERLAAMDESQRPYKVLIIIVTDGEENASVAYTKEKVIGMVAHQRDVYKWEFVFLGADMDTIASQAIARSVGIYSNVAEYSKGATRSTFKKMSDNTEKFRFSSEKTCGGIDFHKMSDADADQPTTSST